MAITTPGAVDYHLASQNASRTMSINALSPVTLMCWINSPNWSAGGGPYSMVGTYNSATAGGTAIQIGSRGGAGTCDVWSWGGLVLVSTTGITMASNAWNHIAYTYDGTTHRIYINGLLNNTGTTAQQAGTITAVYVNGYPGGVLSETSTFSCFDISYSARTMSAAEILTAYTCAGDRDGLYFGQVASLLTNEGTPGSIVTKCLDYGGGLNELTPIGAATGVNFTYIASAEGCNTRPPL